MDERAAKSKFVAQSRPPQGEKLETAKSRAFVSNISSLSLVKSAIYEIQLFVSRISAPYEHSVRNSFCFVVHAMWYIIKNHQNNSCLVIINLDVGRLSLTYLRIALI